jgi:hypothetical protein
MADFMDAKKATEWIAQIYILRYAQCSAVSGFHSILLRRTGVHLNDRVFEE